MKRVLDVVLSSMALLILAPFLLPVMVVLKLTGEGEIFYIQERAGLGGNPFGLYKFATMLKNSPNLGAGEITVREDPRVLPFGKFLRKTKLNEMPQLWNILIGDMSMVGPRPMVLSTYAHYPSETRKKLNMIRPGLTGIGSIVFRDEERFLAERDDPMAFYREHIIPYKNDLELWFCENNSVWVYIKVVAVTAWVVVFASSDMVGKAFKGIPPLPDILV